MDFSAIKRARKAAGITQEELAETIGVNRATISKYENGQIAPSFSQLLEISAAVSVDPFMLMPDELKGAFFAGYNEARETKRMQFAATDDEWEDAENDLASLLDGFDRLDADGQGAGIACLFALAQLNRKGQDIAVARIEELTKVPDYQRILLPKPQEETSVEERGKAHKAGE